MKLQLCSKRAAWLPVLLAVAATASGFASPVGSCTRPAVGSPVISPPERHSKNGVLKIDLLLIAGKPRRGEATYCYITPDGAVAPTLALHPGDRLILNLHNELPAAAPAEPHQAMTMNAGRAADPCHAAAMSSSDTNLHFHGMDIAPKCHMDESLYTAVRRGEVFTYDFRIPADEPPGMYWYHPHIHGFNEQQLQAGASGVILVEGIEQVNPELAKMPERVLVLRDRPRVVATKNRDAPGWDVSLNLVPVNYPAYRAAKLFTQPQQKQLWRVLNAAADTIFDLRVEYDGVAQKLEVVATDGVPENPTRTTTSILLAPGARTEFTLTTPRPGQRARLITEKWFTGPDGDNDPRRPLAEIVSTTSAPALATLPQATRPDSGRHSVPAWERDDAAPIVERKLSFSEVGPDDAGTVFYISTGNEVSRPFSMDAPPDIVAHQGTVEDWFVENRSQEDHVFHIHQIHFRVLEINGKPADGAPIRDTIDVPYWSGHGPAPSVKLRMDFRDPNVVGTFVYHCHILKHSDAGMMGKIEVLLPGTPTKTILSVNRGTANLNEPVTFVAQVQPSYGTAPSEGVVRFILDGPQNYTWFMPVKDGKAILTTPFADTGAHRVSASFMGNSTHDASASKIVDVTIPAKNFRLAGYSVVMPPRVTAATTTVTSAPLDGFNGKVKLQCELIGIPGAASCAFAQTNIPGRGMTSLTVHVLRDAARATLLHRCFALMISAGLFVIFVVGRRRAQDQRAVVVVTLALALACLYPVVQLWRPVKPVVNGNYTLLVTGTSGNLRTTLRLGLYIW